MELPIPTSYAPMEAKLVARLPSGDEWHYEPKFDGFRCLAFRDGDEVDLRSKSGQPFNRYFPEVAEGLLALPAGRFVLDGELVVPADDAFSFDALLMRIHPAKSRVEKLARASPALFVVFDLLVDESGASLVGKTLEQRREALEHFVARDGGGPSLVKLAPRVIERAAADDWLDALGGGLDGIMAKRRDLPYQSGERTGMQKWKRMRTADCVVGGFRYAAKERLVGSLLLGLYDAEGALHHVGYTSSIKADEKAALTEKLERLIAEPGFTGNRPGGPSRWSSERSGEWQPLEPVLVAEVQYDHYSGGRFRHGTKFLRWRPDKHSRKCTLAQVAEEARTAATLLKNA